MEGDTSIITTTPARGPDPRALALLGGMAVVVCALWSATIGLAPAAGAIAAFLQVFVPSALLAGAWLAGAAGIGGLLSGLWRGEEAESGRRMDLLMQVTAGGAVCLFLAHLLGVMGMLDGASGRAVAWLPCVAGSVLLARQVRRAGGVGLGMRDAWLLLASAPAVGMMLAAATVAPGLFWGASEANQFDTLAYHLQLPKEWLATGAIRSLEHNVYSHLPSYVEAAYMQLAAMTWGAEPRPAAGLALGATAAQVLHLGFAVIAALHVRRLVDGMAGRAPTLAGTFAAACFLSTGWVTVVATCAYNEMVVLACFGGALVVARRGDLGEVRRSVLVGLLTAAAVGAKPTGVFMVALPSVVMMVAWSPRRNVASLVRLLAPGGVVAVALLAPWLVRNGMATGNPVFPAGLDVFGAGHWTAEQVARWRGAHTPEGTAPERLGLLFSERGMGHWQWAAFFPLVGLGAIVAVVRRETRGAALWMLGVLGAQVVFRLMLEHQQSRFLLPLAIPGTVLLGLGLHVLTGAVGERGAVWRRLALAPVAALALPTMSNYWGQARALGGPSVVLLAGAPAINGSAADGGPSPYGIVNATVGEGGMVYLLGESRAFWVTAPVLYHSTWDASPLGEALEESDGYLPAAFARLRHREVTHILMNTGELHRLREDGWYDPRITQEVVPTTEGRAELLFMDITDPEAVRVVPLGGGEAE